MTSTMTMTMRTSNQRLQLVSALLLLSFLRTNTASAAVVVTTKEKLLHEDKVDAFPFVYKYDPSRLMLPLDAKLTLKNAHGLEVVVGLGQSRGGHRVDTDQDLEGIYLTFENNVTSTGDVGGGSVNNSASTMNDQLPQHCLVKWPIDGRGVGRFVDNGMGNDSSSASSSSKLCSGEPHGLTLSFEAGSDDDDYYYHDDDNEDRTDQMSLFLYHSNNDKVLSKTSVKTGEIIWQNRVIPDNSTTYRPTWIAVPPDGPYVYLCDGYGSNYVYLMWRQNGTFVTAGDNKNIVHWGGRSITSNNDDEPPKHGLFSTNHGCLFDYQTQKIVVADRENGRLEYFDYFDSETSKYGLFKYSHSTDLRKQNIVSPSGPSLGNASRPCILRRQAVNLMDDLVAARQSTTLATTKAPSTRRKTSEGNRLSLFRRRQERALGTAATNGRHDQDDMIAHNDHLTSENPSTDKTPPLTPPLPQRQSLSYGVVPDLTGRVAIVNDDHMVVYIIEVAEELGPEGHLHPHDAQILPNGDVGQ
jgi:hypothetical protein